MNNGLYGFPRGYEQQAAAFEDEVTDFANRCAALGYARPVTGMVAVNQFVVEMKALGLWAKMDDIGVFVGDFNTAQVKLKYASVSTLTNNGYVSGDYGVNGFTGSSSKYFDTGYSVLATAQYDHHLSIYRPTVVSSTTGAIGSSYTATGGSDRFYIFHDGNVGEGSAFAAVSIGVGHTSFGISANSADGAFAYQNGTRIWSANSSGLNGRQSGTVLLNRAANTAGNGSTLSFYSIGKGFSPTDASYFSTLVNQLQKRLGR